MVKIKLKRFLLVLVAILLLTGTLAANYYPVTITDDLGREVIVTKRPERIISLAPGNTEVIFALGAEDRLVGVTEYADYPKEAKGIESIGMIKEPNIEKIIKLRPDLVLAFEITPKEVIYRLEELGIKVVGFNPQQIGEILDYISTVGRITGQSQKAKELVGQLDSRIDQVTSVIRDNVRREDYPQVFYEIWYPPLYTAGQGTYIDDLIYLAGGVNIAGQLKDSWPQYNLEMLLVENPDIYLASYQAGLDKQQISSRAQFGSIKAIKEGRIGILDPDLVNRAGPRIVDALEQMAQMIHPELFE